MFSLLAEVRWTAPLLRLGFFVVIAEALVFAAIGIGQHIAGEIFWNEALEMSNDFHFYLRVNSLFWDPNIYGRYLATAIVIALGVLVWTEDRLRSLALAGGIAVLFAGLSSPSRNRASSRCSRGSRCWPRSAGAWCGRRSPCPC